MNQHLSPFAIGNVQCSSAQVAVLYCIPDQRFFVEKVVNLQRQHFVSTFRIKMKSSFSR